DGNGGYATPGGGSGVAPTGTLGGWAPGNLPRLLPEGVGMLWPKGADIVLQVHYHKSGKPETDRTRIGIFYCKGTVDKRLRILPVLGPLRIPAGEANYTANGGTLPVFDNASVIEVMPHMHLLGKDMTITAKLPDGTQKQL